MSLSEVAEPMSILIGNPVPKAEAWNAIRCPLGDHVAELPTHDVSLIAAVRRHQATDGRRNKSERRCRRVRRRQPYLSFL
jgi:hypothetical protein